MNKALKRQWIKALRSGEYKQCYGRMHDGEGFCCLGVLADISVDGWWVESERHAWRLISSDSEVGISAFPRLLDEHIEIVLSELNDEGNSFDGIADFIERSEAI